MINEYRLVFEYLLDLIKFATPIILIFLILSKILGVFLDFLSGRGIR